MALHVREVHKSPAIPGIGLLTEPSYYSCIKISFLKGLGIPFALRVVTIMPEWLFI